ncbi:MAG: decarboxylating NADP(+)-dependent phosphogluconate dehydrogenase [Chlamydiales bacterium]
MTQADIGLIGLAVMGQNLVLNMNDHGYKVAVYNRTTSKVEDFLTGPAKMTNIMGTKTLEEFVSKLKSPRRVMLMVKAGDPVDKFIALLEPLLENGDIIIDGGNSHFPDTNRRCEYLRKKGIYFIGTGISGGEEGARHGPSIMPGGDPEAWPHVKKIFQDIAAKVENGEPCCQWVGEGGAGHYVKMVHNGIEYGDIQLICESYALMKNLLDISAEEIGDIFEDWNKRELNSYLIEIASHIFRTRDQDGHFLLDKILDVAGQKGTGKWTAINSVEMGMPVTLIGEAVFARCLSALKEERVIASKKLPASVKKFKGNKQLFINDIFHGLYASKMISYAQGYMLMQEASKNYRWNLNYGGVALMWRGGCIIRSIFLEKIKRAFDKNPYLHNLLLDDFFSNEILKCQEGWRNVISEAAQCGVPVPCLSTALSFYDGYRSDRLPANLLQALRDYFGAHTYERIDKPRGEFCHTNWTGTGGKMSASSYSV